MHSRCSSFIRRPLVDTGRPEPLQRPLKMAYIAVLGVLAVSALGLLLLHLRLGAPSKTHTSALRTTTTAAVQATTTEAPPDAPQPSADAAAQALVSNWSSGNRCGRAHRGDT